MTLDVYDLCYVKHTVCLDVVHSRCFLTGFM